MPISPEVLIVSEEEEPKGEPGIYTFRGGRIVGSKFVYKVKVKNSTDTSITDVVVQIFSCGFSSCQDLETQSQGDLLAVDDLYTSCEGLGCQVGGVVDAT